VVFLLAGRSSNVEARLVSGPSPQSQATGKRPVSLGPLSPASCGVSLDTCQADPGKWKQDQLRSTGPQSQSAAQKV